MVRYHEIIQEKPDTDEDLITPKQMTEKLMREYCPETNKTYFIVNDDGTVRATKWVDFTKVRQFKKLPITFNRIDTELRVVDNLLESFEGLPERVDGTLIFYNNKFTNFRGIPMFVKLLNLIDNPITSLEGLEKGYVEKLTLSWNPNLPLLRCAGNCKELYFPNGNALAHQASEIVNSHNETRIQKTMDDYDSMPLIGKQSNEELEKLNKRAIQYSRKSIYDCQYALIKAGLKASAKW
jgi:hypothetical protein